MITFEDIRDQALRLEPALRGELVELLDASLQGPRSAIDDLDAIAFEAELDRRHLEAISDPSALIPVDVAMAELWECIREKA